MKSGKCRHCGDSYIGDDYGPIKECSCNVEPSERHRLIHQIKLMVEEVTQSHADDPENMYVSRGNLDAILEHLAKEG